MKLLLSVPLLSSSLLTQSCCVVFILLLCVNLSILYTENRYVVSYRMRPPLFLRTCGFSQRPSLLFPLSFSSLQICRVRAYVRPRNTCSVTGTSQRLILLLPGDEVAGRIRKSSVFFFSFLFFYLFIYFLT